jgi:hypothetical protein
MGAWCRNYISIFIRGFKLYQLQGIYAFREQKAIHTYTKYMP